MVKSLEDKETNIKKSGIKIVTLNAKSVKNKDHIHNGLYKKLWLGTSSYLQKHGLQKMIKFGLTFLNYLNMDTKILT